MDIDRFLTFLVDSQLFGTPEAEQVASLFRDECAKAGAPVSAEEFGEFLIATDRITRWQCEKLLDGKWKGFYLDNYLILEQIGVDFARSYYKARNARDGQLVRLNITPSQEPPHIRYTVERYSE
jgi:hypothetical protein